VFFAPLIFAPVARPCT